MKRNLLVIVAMLFVSMGWSQTVTINLKNGDAVEYNLGDIESLVFNEANGNSEETSIVGVWECISYENVEGLFENPIMKVGDLLYINADNTYSLMEKESNNEIDKGTWSLKDNDFIVESDSSKYMTGTFTVLQLDASTFSFTWAGFVTLSFRRVTE